MDRRLGSAARSIRLTAGLDLSEVAVIASVDRTTIARFEAGNGWRRETNAIVAAYAQVAGVTSADVWRAALELDTGPPPPPLA